MTPNDLLDELSVQIYSRPLSLHRDSGKIADVTDPLSVVMLLIDCTTEIDMNGFLDGFIGNSTGLYAWETVEALKVIGCPELAADLARILTLAIDAGVTHEAIQRDRSRFSAFTVTTFNQTHGDKWRDISRTISKLGDDLDFGPVYERLEVYVAEHFDVLQSHLTKAQQ